MTGIKSTKSSWSLPTEVQTDRRKQIWHITIVIIYFNFISISINQCAGVSMSVPVYILILLGIKLGV